MNLFSIAQLEQFSGIKAHNIRIWEQRYNALTPERSKGTTRYYDNSQLKRLLNIVSLLGADYKISTIGSMKDKDLNKLLDATINTPEPAMNANEYSISQLISAGINFDDVHFEKIFASCLLRYGMKNTYINILYPLLVRIGLMWVKDGLPEAPEHFISNLIRQKLFAAIDALPPANASKQNWVLHLPENEFHEIGLLFSNYMIRRAGNKVIYLGSNVPIETLVSIVKDQSPDNILFFLVHHDDPKNAQQYIDMIKKNCTKTKIHIAGREKLLAHLKLGKGVNWIRSVEDLEKQL